jgi:5-methylcytosine-specific restriction endonuclease McrA
MKRTALRRKKPINPVSKRRRKRDKNYQQMRAEVWTRARGGCESWYHASDCTGQCEQVHHLAGRGGKDPHNPANLLGVSAACHRWIEENRGEAYARGLLVRRNGKDAA